MKSDSGYGFLSIFFGGKCDLIQLNRQIIHQSSAMEYSNEHYKFLVKNFLEYFQRVQIRDE